MSIEINDQFKEALNLLNTTNTNLFITGKAGTGKSTLLSHFRVNSPKKIVVLAPTGVAAVNIQGETIHSFFRFKPNVTTSEAIKIAKRFLKQELYRKLDTIVIDEISMVRADLLDCINEFLKTVRSNNEPFGGVQMVFIGDLYQLPPVMQRQEWDILKNFYKSIYFFDSKAYGEAQDSDNKFRIVELSKIYRQSDDKFINLLNAVRNKATTDEHLKMINDRFTIDRTVGESVYLTTRNDQADTINFKHLDGLDTDIHCYYGKVEGEFKGKEFPTDLALDLKVGAKVMFLNNDLMGRWINGTIGTVTEMLEDYVVVKIENGETVEVEPNKWSLYSSYFDEKTGEIKREEIGSFTQIPLRLAWAITIHKSQGKTFENVIIDLGWGAFSHGQVYVALSRCKSFEGLKLVKRLRPADILVDQRIIQFMQNVNN